MTLLHTALRVTDLEASIDFYDDLLDYEIVREFETDDGVRNVFLGRSNPAADDDAALQLLPADGPVETGDFGHVALATGDVDGTVERMDDDLVDGGPMTLEGDDLRVAFVEDPDGYGIELIEQL